MCRDENHDAVAAWAVAEQPAHEVESALVAEEDIHEDDVGAKRFRSLECLDSPPQVQQPQRSRFSC